MTQNQHPQSRTTGPRAIVDLQGNDFVAVGVPTGPRGEQSTIIYRAGEIVRDVRLLRIANENNVPLRWK